MGVHQLIYPNQIVDRTIPTDGSTSTQHLNQIVDRTVLIDGSTSAQRPTQIIDRTVPTNRSRSAQHSNQIIYKTVPTDGSTSAQHPNQIVDRTVPTDEKETINAWPLVTDTRYEHGIVLSSVVTHSRASQPYLPSPSTSSSHKISISKFTNKGDNLRVSEVNLTETQTLLSSAKFNIKEDININEPDQIDLTDFGVCTSDNFEAFS
ncbi:hypothetical protein LguiA_021649 [Lonicera macranthoides]